MWTIYYHAPIGTKVKFRYDLDIKGANGNPVHLKDVYHLQKKNRNSGD
jgi:L,D-transpeptidase ErfK/SrfK